MTDDQTGGAPPDTPTQPPTAADFSGDKGPIWLRMLRADITPPMLAADPDLRRAVAADIAALAAANAWLDMLMSRVLAPAGYPPSITVPLQHLAADAGRDDIEAALARLGAPCRPTGDGKVLPFRRSGQ